MIQVDLTLPTVPITSFSPQTFTTGYYFEIFIGIMVIVGIVRGLVGRRYSAGRVLRTPAIYILFTAFAIYFTKWPNIYAEAVIVLIPIGIPFGIKFGKDVKIFKKENVLYYRRSPYILIIWALALTARAYLELSSFNSIYPIIAINSLLSLITGLLLGEAINILRTHRRTTKQMKSNSSN